MANPVDRCLRIRQRCCLALSSEYLGSRSEATRKPLILKLTDRQLTRVERVLPRRRPGISGAPEGQSPSRQMRNMGSCTANNTAVQQAIRPDVRQTIRNAWAFLQEVIAGSRR